ncbi:MAG: hypothetical protein AAF928_09305 [Myxococcota bacterium]
MCEDRWTSSCVRQSDGTYKCRSSDDPVDPGLHLLATCEVGGADQLCPKDSFCRNHDTCGGSESRCSVFRAQGASCDGKSWATSCALCANGTKCVEADGGPYPDGGYCRKDCENDEDCPCDADGTAIHGCYDGSCYECKDEGERCLNGKYACCGGDRDLRCGGDDVCCRDEGESCSNDGDCCIASFCNDAQECQKCAFHGNPCETDEECCGHGDCVEGACKTPCADLEGKKCGGTLGLSAKGECKVNARWSCAGEYEAVCVPAPPSAEICDEKDNDCNGKVDDNPIDPQIGLPCQVTPQGCHQGFLVDSNWVCGDDGSVVCDDDVSGKYCSGHSQIVNGQSCGGALGNTCSSDADCPPNTVCDQGKAECTVRIPGCVAMNGISSGPKGQYCWMPSDNGTCPYPP